ncbi:MAG: MFS transporter [Pirellulaceae bacterium]
MTTTAGQPRPGEDEEPAGNAVAPGTAEVAPALATDAPRPHEARNFWILVTYQIVMRTGWIFKTESSVMPAAADALDPTGFARGWLPLLNRFGQSVPPVLAARRIKNLRKKQRAFIATTTSMTAIFLAMTSLWLIPGLVEWRPYSALIYLLLYGLFFWAIGVNALAYNTIQGKLIRPQRRGRLLMYADTIGATSAVVCALALLTQWLNDDRAEYELIFGFSTALFFAASIASWLLKEEPDDHFEPRQGMRYVFAAAWAILRDDANFRRLAIVAALFSTSLVLFPHYQALAREELNLGTSYLVWWVVAQNIGTACFSMLTGPIADRLGNRKALLVVTLLIIAAPLAAIGLVYYPALGKNWFAVVFLLIGLTPVAQKTFNNYTLEISESANHPRYLSTLSLCMAAPIYASPLIGGLINMVGFEPVYLLVTLLLLAGFALSFGLNEPRLGSRPPVEAVDTGSITE